MEFSCIGMVTEKEYRRNTLKSVNLGIIGLGNMGAFHAKGVLKGKITHCKLTAVCDSDKTRLDDFDSSIAKFTDTRKLISSGKADAVIIATPQIQWSKFFMKKIKIICMLCLIQLLINRGSFAMEIKEVVIEGKKVVVMENRFYSSILIPEKAMLPLTYKFKPTGNNVFIRRENLERSFAWYDGLVDCLPWVSDRKFPVKGLLNSWKAAIHKKVLVSINLVVTDVFWGNNF